MAEIMLLVKCGIPVISGNLVPVLPDESGSVRRAIGQRYFAFRLGIRAAFQGQLPGEHNVPDLLIRYRGFHGKGARLFVRGYRCVFEDQLVICHYLQIAKDM